MEQTREQQIEILTRCIEQALTLRALLATGQPPDWPIVNDAWDAFLAAAKLCKVLSAEDLYREKRKEQESRP